LDGIRNLTRTEPVTVVCRYPTSMESFSRWDGIVMVSNRGGAPNVVPEIVSPAMLDRPFGAGSSSSAVVAVELGLEQAASIAVATTTSIRMVRVIASPPGNGFYGTSQ
jgi:hypothetical protein